MKPFELTYVTLEPFLPALHQRARQELKALVQARPDTPEILDVGGRKSHYTIGLRANVTVTDLPRETSVQHNLHLGITDEMQSQVMTRRSNVKRVLLDDMTRSHLPSNRFDLVVAIEVLEHVPEDDKFVSEVYRVLKPGGSFFMTTPNGVYVKNANPDHERHYERGNLTELLRSCFPKVRVEFGIPGGSHYARSLHSWSLKRPLRTLSTMVSARLNSIQSADPSVVDQPDGTNHLIAWATK